MFKFFFVIMLCLNLVIVNKSEQTAKDGEVKKDVCPYYSTECGSKECCPEGYVISFLFDYVNNKFSFKFYNLFNKKACLL